LNEDVHQVANYCEIEYFKDFNDKKIKCDAKWRFMWKARVNVLVSLAVQFILLWYLIPEVFSQELTPSGRFISLRLVLVWFMFYLSQAEQMSIQKTKFLVQAECVGDFMRFTNFLRQVMAYMTLGTALWQVFSGKTEETSAVDEIMNFAALLIVLEIDDFLMSSPSQ
jgi:hypothetical protein